jgi:hypothetical protein
MWPSVMQTLPTFLGEEGWIPILYPDSKGIITTGLGHVVGDGRNWDGSTADALSCGFTRKDTGQPATKEEIFQDWKLIQDNPGWSKVFTGSKEHHHNRPLWDQTIVELSDQAIRALIERDARRFEDGVKRNPEWYSTFDEWPADAQLGLIAICWACGIPTPANHWIKFPAACKERNWKEMAANCTGKDITEKRNRITQQAFENAANMMANNAKGWHEQISIVLWPTVLLEAITVTAGEGD